ncbi:MAG TPA: DUF2017 domain-containing protein [Yinghuangia sp.]|uniref:DUF2017 domain-containing protein n=1 Tax=Yinghuangia sp. YIM S10712 TaxID=3436930 RepID=UPI002B6277D0|nr:DUF2017 domain-containing protein [Yinghuangia sp.]
MNGHFVRGSEGRPEIVLDDFHGQLLGELCRGMVDLIEPRPADDEDKGDPLARELGLDGLDWSGLDGGGDSAPERMAVPDDPVLARLLPDAYRDDPDAASEFRRYTENDLRLRKCDNARTVRADIAASAPEGHIVLDDRRIQAWLGALNDLRLALGTDLGVGEDVDDFADNLEPDDPRFTSLVIYRWLGALLESLVESISP